MIGVAVDPRIRARRVSVARDAGRRRLRRLLILVGALGSALLALAITWTPALDVERVDVEGASHTSTEDVAHAADIAPGDPLAWFDVGDAERDVAALPWVDGVDITRSWGGEVRVTVTERVPVAALADTGGRWLLADATGRVLATTDTMPNDVALVDGVTASAVAGDQLDDEVLDALAVAGGVPPGLRPEVARITGSGPSLQAELRAGGVILLGGPEDVDAKLSGAAAVLATVTPGCVDRLDVSLADAPALVRVPGCA